MLGCYVNYAYKYRCCKTCIFDSFCPVCCASAGVRTACPNCLYQTACNHFFFFFFKGLIHKRFAVGRLRTMLFNCSAVSVGKLFFGYVIYMYYVHACVLTRNRPILDFSNLFIIFVFHLNNFYLILLLF